MENCLLLSSKRQDSKETARKHFPAIAYYEVWTLKSFSIANIVIGQMSAA